MRLTNYWWLLIWLFGAGGFLYWFFPRQRVMVNGKYEKSNKASTGLGLYLSKDIVKRHSGEIYAKSSPENTCEFGFSIPKGANVLIEEKSAS